MVSKVKQKITRQKADELLTPILSGLRKVGKVEVCGSYRRGLEYLGDIDLLGDKSEMVTLFLTFGEKSSAGEKGATILIGGVQIDLKIVPDESWGSGLMMWTGSKLENVRLRSIAKSKGFKLNEYGLWDGGKNLSLGMDEESIYGLLGQRFKSPEERSEPK